MKDATRLAETDRPMNVALISYHLYNVTAEGLQAAKIACLMRDRGHRVEVFTSDHNWLDGTRVEPREGPLEGLVIHRIPSPDVTRAPAWRRQLLDWQSAGGLRAKIAAVPNLINGANHESWTWAQQAARAVVDRARARPFDVMHTRLNPPQSHLAGFMVKRRIHSLPWCAYFSDPWPFHRFPPPYASRTGRLLHWRLERHLATLHRHTDSLVYPSAWLRDAQLEPGDPHQAAWREKSHVIPHVTNIWEQSTAKEPGPTLRILHAGFLMAERKTDALFDAVRRLLVRRPEARSFLRLEFIGRYRGRDVPLPPEDLEEVVIYHRFERPSAIWPWLQGADVLMLVEADLERGIFFPSKLADYLGCERPILALSPTRGVAADLLGTPDADMASGKTTSGTLLAPPTDAPAIERALETVVEAWQSKRLDTLLPVEDARRTVSRDNVSDGYARALAFAHSNARGNLRS